MPPYRVRRGRGRNRGLFGRLLAAPTGALAAVSRCRGALYMRPNRTPGITARGCLIKKQQAEKIRSPALAQSRASAYYWSV